MLYKIENLLKEIKEKLVQNSEILTNVKKKECEKFKECLSKHFDQICFDKLKIFELKNLPSYDLDESIRETRLIAPIISFFCVGV